MVKSEYRSPGRSVNLDVMSRPLLALILWLVFAAIAFGWRTVVQVRRYGDSGWRFSRDAPALERIVQLMFVISIVLAVVAPVAAIVAGEAHLPGGVSMLADGSTVATMASVLGAAALLAGSALAVVAQIHMGESWRIGVDEGERTDLVTGGLFAWVRNPIFSGMLLAVVGGVLLVPNAISAACLVLSVIALQAQVRMVEEPYLVVMHGEPYRRWASRTGRFVPGLGRLGAPEPG